MSENHWVECERVQDVLDCDPSFNGVQPFQNVWVLDLLPSSSSLITFPSCFSSHVSELLGG